MDYLSNPIPVELFDRLFRKARRFDESTLFIGFTQTETKWTATYQDYEMILLFSGRTSVTKTWIAEALEEEAHP